MAATIESTNDPRQMAADFERVGIKLKPAEPEVPAPEEAKPLIETNEDKPAKLEAPGGKAPAATDDETASDQETDETKQQETSPKGEKKSTDGFKKKLDQKTRQLEEAREALELEAGDKSKLRARIEELEEQLEALQPSTDGKEQQLVKPKEPEMPDLADFDFDTEKFKAAMKKYRADMVTFRDDYEEYRDKITERKAADAVRSDREERAQEEQQRAAQKAIEAFNKRVKDEGSEIEGYWDYFAENEWKVTLPQAAEAAILESDHPARVIWHLVQNPDDIERLKTMNELQQVRFLASLETRLESAGKKTTATEERTPVKTAANTPAEKPPVTEKRTRTPEDPIQTTRGSSTAATSSGGDANAAYSKLVAAGDSKGFVDEFNRRRAEKLGRR